jgi:hypothetical protein
MNIKVFSGEHYSYGWGKELLKEKNKMRRKAK